MLLADWGSSHTFFAGVPSAAFNERSKSYAAPEVLAQRAFLPSQAECWSLGVTLYAMASGRLPFDLNSPTFATDVATGNFEMPPHVSIRLRAMIHGLLSVDPVIRFSMFGAAYSVITRSYLLPQISNTTTSSAAQSFPALLSLLLPPRLSLQPPLSRLRQPPVPLCLISSLRVPAEHSRLHRAALRSAASATPPGVARYRPHR